MTVPSKQDVDAMANIMKALSGKRDTTPIMENASTDTNYDASSLSGKTEDVKEMENILKNFYSASNNVSKKVINETSSVTKTASGIELGMFTIDKVNEAYNIKDTKSEVVIFENLRLYETAYMIVKYLNEGKKINSPEITKIISTNALFENYYYDALTHKNSYNTAKKKGDRVKMDIYEARFDRAKTDAMSAKKQIKTMYNRIKL